VNRYLTVSPDYHVQVSRRLKDEFDNGKEYYALAGKSILLPGNPAYRPSTEHHALQHALQNKEAVRVTKETEH
jgi:hypothetical protein